MSYYVFQHHDAEYFRFTGKLTTSDIFTWMGMSNDIFNLNYLNHLYQYMEGDWVLFHDVDNPTGLYNFKTDSLLNRNIIEHSVPEGGNVPLEGLESRFKSIVQQLNSRMINNNLTDN